MYVPDEQHLASAWSPPGRPAYAFRLETGGHATLGVGLSVAYRFAGIPTAYAEYPSVRLVEDPAVVVVAPVAVLTGPGSRRRYAETREVTFRLQQPLGNRVLVNPDGQPVTVVEPDLDALLPAGRGDR